MAKLKPTFTKIFKPKLIIFDTLAEYEPFLTNELPYIYSRMLPAIEHAFLTKHYTATAFELIIVDTQQEMFLKAELPEWAPLLTEMLEELIKWEDYEACSRCKSLLEKVLAMEDKLSFID